MRTAKPFENYWYIKDMGYTTPCWIWIGAISSGGYPQYQGRNGAKSIRVHRYMYELHRDKIPLKHDLHHLCKVKNCINPEHLKPVTRSQHVRITDREHNNG